MKTTSVKVGSRWYDIEEVDHAELLCEDRHGDITYFAGRIRIPNSGTESFRAEVLVHELLHAIIHDSGLPIPADREEDVVQSMSPRLAALLADNPEFVRELVRMFA